jgi:hypothetical protein
LLRNISSLKNLPTLLKALILQGKGLYPYIVISGSHVGL